MREARAYNQSIYLMVTMPYFLLGVVSFMIYRSFKNAARAQATAGLDPKPIPSPNSGE